MARVKQFADDLGISKNKAQALINKGRSRKDGGSQILEKVMKKPIYAEKGKVVKLKKGDNSKAVSAQFKNLVNASTSGKISPAEAEKMIRKLVLNKKAGGAADLSQYSPLKPRGKFNTAGIDGSTNAAIKELGKGQTRKKKKSNVDDFKDAPKFDKRKKDAKKMLSTVKKITKRKDGGLQDIPSDNKGLPNLPTEVRNKMGYKKAGGVLNMSRGGGIAIQGLGFKGIR